MSTPEPTGQARPLSPAAQAVASAKWRGGGGMDGIIFNGNYPTVRISKSQPTHYRLARKGENELVFQGWFAWQEGPLFGGEWRNIPIVEWSDTTPPYGQGVQP